MKVGTPTATPGSDESTSAYPQFIGPVVYEVVAVCPTKKELNDLGRIWIEEEPNYIVDFGGEKYTEIHFVLKSVNTEKFTQFLDLKFNISHEDKVAIDGKYLFIDICGKGKYEMKESDLKPSAYFSNIDVRKGKKNEPLLYDFISKWTGMTFNAEKGIYDECRFDIKKIIKGDLSEIRAFYTDNVLSEQEKVGVPFTCYVLTGVQVRQNNDKEYHNLVAYNKKFYSSKMTPERAGELFEGFIEKSDYNSFGTTERPVEYTTDSVIRYIAGAPIAPDKDPGEMENAPVTEGDDDVPF